MNQITITLPPPNSKLHAHAKGHWRSKAKATKALRNEACLLAIMEQRGRRVKWKKAKVTYRFYFANRRRRDAANAVQAMKPAIDGVVDSGLLPDDCWEVLEIAGVECHVDRKNPRTELVFDEVAE